MDGPSFMGMLGNGPEKSSPSLQHYKKAISKVIKTDPDNKDLLPRKREKCIIIHNSNY
jgi:hypothetical protein